MTRSYVHPLHFLAHYFLHPALASGLEISPGQYLPAPLRPNN
jgi:hypothetical protein